MTDIQAIKKKQLNVNELKKIEKHIKSATFLLVKDYYGDSINEIDKKEKRKTNLKINKALTRKVHQVYKVTHLKKIQWMDYVDVMMYIDSVTIDDLKYFL
jgi:hypothetical protein